MSVFDWKSEYSIGIQSIDIQHKKIIDLIDELVESIRNSREDYIINDVLRDLSEYAKSHFSLEEKILHKYSIAKEQDHKNKHKEFIEKIHQLKTGKIARAGDIPRETLDYLEHWFFEHELKLDSEYGKYLMGKGLINEIEFLIIEGKI